MVFRRRLPRCRAVLSALLAGAFAPPAIPLQAAAHVVPTATSAPSLEVEISRLTPAVLTPGADVTIRGTVRNPGKTQVTGAQVYLAIPTDPFTSHEQARDAIESGTAQLGHRLTADDLVDSLGDVNAGDSEGFSLTIPHEDLGISGQTGVYAVDVHVRTSTLASAGRSSTLLPLRPETNARTGPPTPVPTSVVWPFLLPSAPLGPAVSPGGQLRNLLDLAQAAPRRGSDILIDPALLSQARALAGGGEDAPESQQKAAGVFVEELVRLAHDRECWATSFDRPDFLALEASSAELVELVGRATNGTLSSHQLRCPQMEWPTVAGLNRTLLSSIEDWGTDVTVVRTSTVPDWRSQSGDVAEVRLPDGSLPLLVHDPVDAEAVGDRSPLTLRQRILSEATWSSLTGTQGSTVVVVDPRWNPGTSGYGHLDVAMDNKYVMAIGLDEQLEEHRDSYAGQVLSATKPKPISLDQIGSALDAAHTQQLMSRVLVEPEARLAHDQQVAMSVSQRWRANRAGGEAYARAINKQLHDELADLSVEGPAALTLSSSVGRFPVTVLNKTSHRVQVGTVIESSNSRVKITVPKGSVIEAGESRTVTAAIDMDGQSTATVSIHLTTSDGAILGAPSVFNVRSSRVGAALWVAIGLSVAFVAIALLRRFARPGHRPEHPVLPPDDFDD